jgi:ADP-ribosylglycohydrolase
MRKVEEYKQSIYAGVLGKIIGVYFGRPVEGWTYDRIRERFGEIEYYENRQVGAPLIVPDDDISGTFAFYRALEDNGYPRDIGAARIGEAWLNYIVENKTILWWGGLSRSTEHTAYLRLKSGIPAPESGSVELNGRSMAEQIGAQIFIDSWAMANPGDPEGAARMAREAAGVSHGGIAIEAACYIAAMEALAFDERRVDALFDEGLRYQASGTLERLVGEVRGQCAGTRDWRDVRHWIAENHGYERYPGNCPIVTNHLVVLMALILGGDDFQKSLAIAASAGWDTDCNCGNLGALNGIRLGLDGIEAGADLRSAVADRLYVCTADGGECVTDAAREARSLIRAAAALRGEAADVPKARFAFEFPGSTQGFVPYPGCADEQALSSLGNSSECGPGRGLALGYRGLGRGKRAAVSVDTFVGMEPKGKAGTSYFEVIASPSLYSTQFVRARVRAWNDINPSLRFFVDYYDADEAIATIAGEPFALSRGISELRWEVPDSGGGAIYRLGIELVSERRADGEIVVESLDWSGAPREFRMGGSMEMTPSLTPWTTQTTWLKAFVSSAENFCPDYTTTFSISHPRENGVATIGTRDWRDYSVESTITFSQQKAAGLVARARGHRRYYCAVLTGGRATIAKRVDDIVKDLASVPFAYAIDETHALRFAVKGDVLSLSIDGNRVVEARDGQFSSGGAGFIVDSGAILGHRFVVKSLEG